MSDYSADFYRQHASRYAEVAHQYLQSVYIEASHPDLKGDVDLLERLKATKNNADFFDAMKR